MPHTRETGKNVIPLPPAAPPPAMDAVPANGNGYIHDEVVRLPEAHPLAHLAGKYNDEPLWNDFLQAMQDVRRQMNAQEEDAEKTDVHSGLG